MKILMAPAHYILSDKVGSEPYVAYKILEYLSETYDIYLNAIVGYLNIEKDLPSNVKITTLYTHEPKFDDVRKLKFYLDTYIKSHKLLNNWKPDIIHHLLPFGYEQTFNFLALLNKLKNTPFIIGPVQNPQIFVGADEYVGEKFTSNKPLTLGRVTLINIISKSILKKLFIKTINKATKIIAVNSFTKKLYSKYTSEEKIIVIPLGVEVSEFEVKKESSKKTKEHLEIFYAGMLTMRKGVEYLIRAYKQIIMEFPNSILRICGKGPQINYLKKLCKNLHLQKKVIFEGFVPRNKLIEFYRKADVFVLPSLSESFGLVLLEAMAAGTPCIASNIVGPNEIVEHGKTGFLFPPKDVKSLVKYLTILLEDEKLRKKMGRKARKKVEKVYDWKVIANQYYRVYKEIIEHV